MAVRVFEPIVQEARIHPLQGESEFDIQAQLYARLNKDLKNKKMFVKGEVSIGVGKGRSRGTKFDLVVFRAKTAVAIVEIKTPARAEQTDFESSLQILKYRQFGVPVIAFWDLSRYEELLSFLIGTDKESLKPVESIASFDVRLNREALDKLRRSLDISSMRAFDCRSGGSFFKNLEAELEQKRDEVKDMLG